MCIFIFIRISEIFTPFQRGNQYNSKISKCPNQIRILPQVLGYRNPYGQFNKQKLFGCSSWNTLYVTDPRSLEDQPPNIMTGVPLDPKTNGLATIFSNIHIFTDFQTLPHGVTTNTNDFPTFYLPANPSISSKAAHFHSVQSDRA